MADLDPVPPVSAVSTASPLAAQQGGVATPAGSPDAEATATAAGASTSSAASAETTAATPDTGTPGRTGSAAPATATAVQSSAEIPWFWLIFTIVVAALITAYIVNNRNAKRPPL